MKNERDTEIPVISVEHQESLEYAEQVELELKKREESLANLDEQIGLIENELKETARNKSLLSCNAFKIVSLELYKKKLRKLIEDKKSKRKSFENEVKKARERKKQIDEEIKTFKN